IKSMTCVSLINASIGRRPAVAVRLQYQESGKAGLLVSLDGSALVPLARGCAGGSMAQLTVNGLRAKWPGKDRWLSDGGARGAGRLVARIRRNGTFFYFIYFSADGEKRPLPLGPFDVDGQRGLSLAAARERADELSRLYRGGITDLHAHVEEQRVLLEQRQKQAALARQAEEAATVLALANADRFSLRKFLAAY